MGLCVVYVPLFCIHIFECLRRNALRKLFTAACLAFVITGCATELVGTPAALDKIESPSGMAIHPNGKYAYVVGSNFDLEYRATDGGALYVVDLENNTILPSSKRMGSFGTNIVLSSDARHGYTVTRDDDALVWFEISEDGSSISCPLAKAGDEDLLDCRIIIDDDPSYISITRSYRETPYINSAGNPALMRVDFDLLMIAQMRNARVMAMTVREAGDSLLFSKAAASLVYSASEIIHIGGENFIVTGRAASNLTIATPAISAYGEVKGLYNPRNIAVPNANSAYMGRGMALDPTGQNLYLINQYPDSLIQFNISGVLDGDNATDLSQANKMMMLPESMSKIQWVGDFQTGMLYLTSVSKDRILIVNPRQMEIEHVIDTGKGPYEMVLRDQTLYVLHFQGNSIWSFDVSDPASPVILNKYLENNDSTENQSTEAP
jgi:DNA-binding beta-propeller fold protein YncE